MKKKLMMVAVLLGALSLGACVDDNESASVTNIRDAKAAQLQAMATLYQAQADAAASAAAAEAQLKAAEAAYQQALADAAAADAAMKEELLNQAQQKFALELQKLQAQYAASIAYWNQLKAKFEGKLWDNENANVQAVYDGYVTAQSAVNTFTKERMQKQVVKAQLEASVIPAEEAVQQQINEWNTELKDLQRDLAKLKSMQEAQPSDEEYKDMLADLEVKAYEILNNGARTAKADERTKKLAFEEATTALSTTTSDAFVLAATKLDEIQRNPLVSRYSSYSFVTSENIELAEAEREAYKLKWQSNVDENSKFTFVNKYNVVSTNVDLATLRLNNAFTAALEAADENIAAVTGEEWEVDATTGVVTWGKYQVKIDGTDYYTVNGVAGYKAYYGKALADAQKELERLQTVLAGEEAKGDAANQTLIERYESQIAYQANLIDGTVNDDFERVNNDGQGDYYYYDNNGNIVYYYGNQGYEANVKQTADWEIQAQANLNKFTEDKAKITDLQKEYQTALASFNDAANQKAYTDAIAALETPAKEYVAAQDAAEEYDEQLADLGFEIDENAANGLKETGEGTYADIEYLLDGIYDVQDLIDAKNQAIADITSSIQSSTALGALVQIIEDGDIYYYDPVSDSRKYVYGAVVVVANVEEGDITLEDAIAMVDAEIALLDTKIEAQQALADKYKAQLDAYLNTGEEPTPETPSEETPSEEQPAEETPAA